MTEPPVTPFESPEDAPPPEPPPPDPAPLAPNEPPPRFRLAVAGLIALVSIVGAGVAWSASTASTDSSDLDQQAQQEFLLREQILTSARAAVGEELRRVGSFQEQVSSERILREQAKRFRISDPQVAGILDQQAQGAAALARTTGYFFFAAFPTVGADGSVTYNPDQAINNLLSRYTIYQQLQPEATAADADEADKKSKRIVGIGVILVAALFLLTLAEIAGRRSRFVLAAAGIAALAAGCVLWGLVEGSAL